MRASSMGLRRSLVAGSWRCRAGGRGKIIDNGQFESIVDFNAEEMSHCCTMFIHAVRSSSVI